MSLLPRFGRRQGLPSLPSQRRKSLPNPGTHKRREVELRDSVDIYFVLLGLPAGRRPPDHYTLLGLPPLTDSQRQINAAVERQMAKLTPLLLSPQGRRVQRIIGEVLEARDVLSSERRKRAYDAELVDGCNEPDANAETRELDVREVAGPADVISPASRPKGSAQRDSARRGKGARKALPVDVDSLLPPPASEPLSPAVAPPVEQPIPLAPSPAPLITPLSPFAQLAELRLAPLVKDFSLSEMSLDILQPRTANDEPVDGNFAESPQTPFIAPAPLPIIAPIAGPEAEIIPTAIPVSEFASYDQPKESPLPTPAAAGQHVWTRPSGDDVLAGVSRGDNSVSSRRQDSSQWTLIVVASVVGGAALAACLGLIANQRQNARTAENSSQPPTSSTAKRPSSERVSPKPQTSAGPKLPATAPEDPAPTPITPKATQPEETPNISTLPASDSPKSSVPPPDDPPQPSPTPPGPKTDSKPTPPPAADPKQVKAVTAALSAARTALGKRDVAEAGKELDLALLEATSAELVAKIENEKTLHHYVDGFWGAVRERIKGLQGGEELAVGKQVVIVVEKRGDRIIIRDRGANKTVGVRDMPAPLAAALAESWLKKEDPNSAVFIGAFWSVDAKGDEKRGRQILEDAKQNGAEAAAGVLEALGPAK